MHNKKPRIENQIPKVFISYSHESKEHQDRVLKLSNDLRAEGIDCLLDQYQDSPPEGWPKWMDHGLKNSDFVLVICTESYYEKVMGTEEKGFGIKWESTLIYQYLYNAGATNTKFIPVLFQDGKFANIPELLQGSTIYNVDDQNDFDKLYWRLRGVKVEKPALGKLRELPLKARKTLFISELIDQEEWEQAKWKNGVGYLWSKNDEGPPAIILFFESMKKGEKLFSDLIKKVGQEDKLEQLRVSIVEGSVPYQKDGYFVLIGENHSAILTTINDQKDLESVEYIAVNQRFHRIYTKEDSFNLKKFKEEFEKYKCYYIGPGVQLGDGKGPLQFEFDSDQFILKRNIEFRNYDDIPEFNDPESILKTEEVQRYKF
jgi:hypothetical protein